MKTITTIELIGDYRWRSEEENYELEESIVQYAQESIGIGNAIIDKVDLRYIGDNIVQVQLYIEFPNTTVDKFLDDISTGR